MIKITIEVKGMACGMCESYVNDAIRRINGVRKVASSHRKNLTIVIMEDNVNQEEIINAISALGYTIGTIECEPYVKHKLWGGKNDR
ncbi:MAG: heavy-metal-associated domain-containing protein [Bacilli bacterium]